MRKSFLTAAGITAAMVIMTGCGQPGANVAASSGSTPATPATSTATSTAAAPAGGLGHSCGPPTAPAGTSLTLTSADSGKTYCVGLGTTVLVYLKGTLDRRWTPIRVSSSALRPAASGHLALALGVTGASFVAARAGEAVISSTRPVCGSGTASPGALSCDAIQGFRATVMISS